MIHERIKDPWKYAIDNKAEKLNTIKKLKKVLMKDFFLPWANKME